MHKANKKERAHFRTNTMLLHFVKSYPQQIYIWSDSAVDLGTKTFGCVTLQLLLELIPCYHINVTKSLELILRFYTQRQNLLKPNLEMVCSE